MYGFAGILKVYVQNFGTVDAFCIDIFTPIDDTDDLLVNGPLPGTAGDLSSEVDWGKVNYLLKTYYSSSMSSNEAAALQCAIWYFTSAPYGTYSAGKTKWQYLTYTSSINRNRYDGMTQSGSNSVVTRAWQMINAATSIDYPYQITLEPETTRVANGGTVTLTATVRDQNGDVMSGVTVNFSTDKGSITTSGTTNSNGQVTATLSGVPSNSTATVLAGVSGKYGNLLYDNPNDPAQNLVVPNLLAYTIRDYSYINFDATANVTLTQTVNGVTGSTPQVNVGDPVTYVVTATNTGPSTATGILISDIIPSGLSNVTVTASNGNIYYDSTNGIWTIASLSNGSSVTLTISGYASSAMAGQTTTNTANRTAQDQYNGKATSTSASVYTRKTDLVLSQTVNGQSTGSITGNVGDNITYIVTVKNNGPDTATNINIKDVLPGLTGATITPSVGTYNSTTGIWTIPTLASGVNATLTIKGLIGSSMAGLNTTNVANVTSQTEYDPTIAGSTSIPVYTKLANVTITQTINNGSSATANVGDTITYVITAANSGLDAATGLQIADLLPSGLSNINYNINGVGTYNSTTGLWNIGTLTKGTTTILTITGKITTALAGLTTTNYANRTAQNEYNPSTNTTNTTLYTNQANVGLTQTVNGGSSATVNVGDTVTILVTATNNGPNSASNINISELLPAGFTPDSITAGTGSSYSGGVWAISSMANGANTTLTITGKATAAMAGVTVNNTVNRTSQTEYNGLPSSNTATIYTKLSDPILTQTVNNQDTGSVTVNVGDTVKYVVNAYCSGPDNATKINIKDVVPAGLTDVTVTPSVGTYNSTTGIWTIDFLEVHTSATLTIIGKAGISIAGTNITNNALEINQTEYNPTPGNSTSIPVYTKLADVALTQTGGYQSDSVTFIVTATNNGPDSATNINIKDMIPSGLTCVTVTPSVGTYNSTTGIWTIPELLSGTFATLNITGTATPTTTVTNTANKTKQTEYDPKTLENTTLSVYIPSVKMILYLYPAYYDTKAGTYQTKSDTGNSLVYCIDLRNNGIDDATGVIVKFVLGDGYEFIDCNMESMNSQGINSFSYDNSTRTITWNIGYMPAKGMSYLKVFLNVIGSTTTSNLTVNASISGVKQYDVYDTRKSANYTITTPTSADIQVEQTQETKTDTENNTHVTYTITVTNNGPDNATGVQITDILSTKLINITYAISYDNGQTWTESDKAYNSTNGIWNIGNLTNNNKVILKITALVNGTGTIKNTATRTAINEKDYNYDNNAQTCILTVSGQYDPSVKMILYLYPSYYDTKAGTYQTKSDTGNSLVYCIDLRNNGIDDATGVIVKFVLGDGYEFIDCNMESMNSQGINSFSYDNSTRTITWNIGYMPAKGMSYLKVFLNVIGSTTTSNLTVNASISGVKQYDVYDTRKSANYTITTPTSADIQVEQTQETKTDTENNTHVTYTITVTNNGPDNATGVQITDILSTKLINITYAISYDNGQTWTESDKAYNSTNGIWNIGNLTNNNKVILKITALVNGTGVITNTATRTAINEKDYNYNNNAQTCIMTIS
ncbi:Ig-like domain-containing protein [uncultured Methanobacterium sp.]|uniref:Ig-like domain-containing protein n=1 Tax=uncultured Methanobacterium sp. TaxID=176306 RepID=UPI002AA91325|nr:invasin domain 3-containing protein [uncultured Methanobacterium sp.]